MAGTFHSGKLATASIGGPGSGSTTQLITISAWTCRPTVGRAQFINNNSGGHVLREGTIVDMTGTITGDFDFGNNPYLASGNLNINVGTLLTNLTLYLKQTAQGDFDGLYFQASSALVVSTPVQVAVSMTGKPMWSCDWEGTGTVYTVPGLVTI